MPVQPETIMFQARMRILSSSRAAVLISSALITSFSVQAQFVAYNDHAPGAGTSPNATPYDVFGLGVGSSGPLKDIQTGATLPVTLTITTTASGVTPSTTQASPAAGTPLYSVFNGFVDFQGTPNPSIELTPGGVVTYTFTGLNPNRRYKFSGSAVRGVATYTNRWTLFELAGTASFSSAHTANVLTNAKEPLVSLNQGAINTGVNNTPETGDMVVWDNIDPGSEGSFSVNCQQYDGPVPNGSSAGVKGYGLTGIRLEELESAGTPAAILVPPQSQTVQESQSVTFTVAALGNPAPTYQWFKDGAPIAGATTNNYTIVAAPFSYNGAVFKVTASNRTGGVDYTATSNDATLTVTPDTTAPTLVDVQAVGFNQVKVIFSERVSAASATNLQNYILTSANGDSSISSATLNAAENTALLNVSALTEGLSYTLSISGIRDQSGSSNLIAPTQKTFAAITYTPLDIGTSVAGRVTPAQNGYDVSGSGADIAGARDQFHFAYQQRTGDFDVRARVADLTITDAYVKAGLMVRDTLQDSSRFAAIFASSAQLGSFFESRSAAAGTATLNGPTLRFPANYPWAWLRLRRSGNDFIGYGSFDGNAWQQLGAVNLAVASQVYFGFAVTSGNTNKLATAKFRDISDVENATSFTYKPTHEAIGPANRRTGIIFSEIMYHSKPRSDGRSMDFVEIYNAEPIFIDMTGWKIAGGIDFTFPVGFQIGAGQFVVIASDPELIQSVYGISGVLGPYQRQLSDNEDKLTLLNQAGAVRDESTYSSQTPWPVAAAGAGHSLVCANPSYGEDDVRAWGASELIGGSPGYDDPIVPHPWQGIVINEFLAVPSATQIGFIELYNNSNSAVDLSGCFLTDSTAANKFRIPDSTRIEARSWISFPAPQLGFAVNSAGGSIYLIAADQSRVLDAVAFDGQERGVSVGRVLDGPPAIRRLATATPAQQNSDRRQEDIVINEIMYNAISGDSDDEYVELYNRSASPISLAGWTFTTGIDFTFPAGASIPADGYVVVAKNVARMLSKYPQLNAANTFGDFDGQLKGSGERLALAKPGLTASEFVTIGEVNYRPGGRWHDLANGGGSSLELKDTHADPTLAPNWAASDETQKSQWATYEFTGNLNQANQVYPATKFFIMAQGAGEYLVDDIEVFRPGSTNLLTNPGFESGQSPWTFYGTHRTSFIQTSGAASGNNCLYLRATEVGDEGPNSVRGSFPTVLTANVDYTIRAKLRWLSGWPEILLRVRGNGIEFPVKLNIPANLGTPGLANSRRVANAGPAITDVTHYPPLPAANEPVLVTARIDDPDGFSVPQLVWRVDPAVTTTSTAMLDDGTGGDELAGDGIYSATIPARPAGLVAVRIEAQDHGAPATASSIFPNDAPKRECLIRWADPAPFGSFGHYHLWSTAANTSDITSRPGQDRTYRDCTIVYDTRVIYNAGWRNKGSPFHSGIGSYSVGFPDDDQFLASDKHVFRSTGNGGDETTEMADDISYWIAEKMGLPFNHARYVRVYRNGVLHYRIDYDLEVPDRSIAKDWFGGGGLDDTLYKIAGWFEYDDSNGNGTAGVRWSTLEKRPANAPPFKTAAYRFNWQPHPGGKTANDYSFLFNLVAGANAADKVTQLMNVADMEEWMRTFAHRRVIGDWDSWSFQTGQNMYMYAPLGERARLMSWDMDFVLGLGRTATEANLFTAGEDPVVAALFNVPLYRRMLCRAYLDAANGPLQQQISDPQFDSRRSVLLKNNIAATTPTGLKAYVSQRRTYLTSQMKAIDAAAFTVSTQDFTSASPTATITGLAPFGVATIEINGVPYPITWTAATAWSIKVPLGAVTNVFQIVGKDLRGNIYSGATGRVTVTYTGAIPQPADWVSINEIMYNAALPDAEFIEIYNSHPTYAFDLSGYKLKGADFTFPPGALIQPNNYLVIAKDSAFFAAAYGATIPLIGEYTGRLQNGGETLSLVKPGATPAQEVIVDQVHYDSVFPWPPTANGFGPSLQRIDPTQDSWRAGNWSVTATNDINRATPGRANVNRATIDPFPQLWINEIVAVNQTGAKDSAGERDPWIEIYNSSAQSVDLTLYYLSNDPSNPLLWQFPFGTTIGAGEFLVIWADNQPLQATASELHANFRLGATGGVVALSRIQLGAAANVDYAYYPGLAADQSYGSIFDGDTETRRLLFLPTPGQPNNPGELIVPVSINEWMPSNVRVLKDPADLQFEDWFELYNRGTNTVDLSGYFLSDSSTNATKFQIPFGYTVAPHGFLLVWANDETNQNQPTNTDLHVNFKMSKDGDSIALFTPNGVLLDAVTFGALSDNISGGRYPDGASALFVFGTPTPRSANIAPAGTRFTRIVWDGAQLNIGWRSTVGRNYRLEATSDLNQPAWVSVADNLTATTTTTTINLAPSAGNRFFRVVQVD